MDSEIALRHENPPALEAWTAQHVLAAVVESGQAVGLIVPSGWRSILGRHAKTLLADGFRADMVVAACLLAVQRRRPEVAQSIAGDLMVAELGLCLTRTEYETKIGRLNAKSSLVSKLLEAEEARREAREQRIVESRGREVK